MRYVEKKKGYTIAGVITTALITIIKTVILLIERLIYLIYFKIHSKVGKKSNLVAHFWEYQSGSTCAINTQRIILRLFDMNKSESELALRQASYGMYDEKKGACNNSLLLEGYGLKCKEVETNKKSDFLFKLFRSLFQNKICIINVNAYLLNNRENFYVNNTNPIYDHSILITSLERKRIGEFDVIYTDTGTFDGSMKRIDFKIFYQCSEKKFIESPRIVIRGPIDNDSGEVKKIICCPNCSQKLRIPFDKKLNITCKKCHVMFSVEP
jgi:hypothetical protein